MKVEPTALSDGTSQQAELLLFKDGNGNWFVSVETRLIPDLAMFCTGTYDTPFEAIQEAVHRLNL